jgi:hypothetical protein
MVLHPAGSDCADSSQPACTAPCFPQIAVSPEIQAITADIITLIGLRQVAAHVPDEKLRCEMQQDVERSLSKLIDEYCGTPSSRWLGPQADIVSLVGALGVAAQSFANEIMRDQVLQVAGHIVQKTAGATLKV